MILSRTLWHFFALGHTKFFLTDWSYNSARAKLLSVSLLSNSSIICLLLTDLYSYSRSMANCVKILISAFKIMNNQFAKSIIVTDDLFMNLFFAVSLI